MKYFKIFPIFLVTIMIMGTFSGIYAINTELKHDSSVGIPNPFNEDGSKTIYVSNAGSDNNSGVMSKKPKRTIQNAIDSAEPGDIVLVAPGIYKENVKITKNITLKGTQQNNTIIDGQKKDSCIRISHESSVTITNFTIKNGKGWEGGGISNRGELTVADVYITKNTAYAYGGYAFGGGVYNMCGGFVTMSGVTITNNIADTHGGGIFNDGKFTLINSNVSSNKAPEEGGEL